MAKDVNTKSDDKTETKKVETPKVDEMLTIASAFHKKFGRENNKDKKVCADKIVKHLHSKGKTKTKKGNDINQDLVMRQINAMLADIKKERGKNTGAWWSKYNIVDKENLFQVVPK